MPSLIGFILTILTKLYCDWFIIVFTLFQNRRESHIPNFDTPVADRGVGGGDRGDDPPPWTCPDPENLCKVHDRDRSPPPPLECCSHAVNVQGGGVCLWMSSEGLCQFFAVWITLRRQAGRQCSRGGGVLVNAQAQAGSVCHFFGGWMTSRRQYPRGGA